jgi:hypothetical protein
MLDCNRLTDHRHFDVRAYRSEVRQYFVGQPVEIVIKEVVGLFHRDPLVQPLHDQLQRMDQFNGAIGGERRKHPRLRRPRLDDEAFPVNLEISEFRSAQLGMIWLRRVLVGPMMPVVILDTKNRQIRIDCVGVIAVDMV